MCFMLNCSIVLMKMSVWIHSLWNLLMNHNLPQPQKNVKPLNSLQELSSSQSSPLRECSQPSLVCEAPGFPLAKQ